MRRLISIALICLAALGGAEANTGYPPVIPSLSQLAPPQFYLAGFQPSAGGNATSVSLAKGTASDSTNAIYLNTTGACAVDLATAGAGGLDTGAIAANTWYALYVIQKPDGTVNCLGHATTAAAVPAVGALTFPSGYTYARYVARAKTNAGAATINATTILPAGQFYVDASDTYTVCSGLGACKQVRFLACGGGASGASGGRQVSATAISGGSGGSGGGCMDETYAASQLASPVSATIGAGGAQVNPPGTDNTAGTTGNDGNPSFFGPSAAAAYVYGGKGCAGSGGQLNAASASGGAGMGDINTTNMGAVCTDGSVSTAGNGQTPSGQNGASGATGSASTTAYIGLPGGGSTAAGASGGGGNAAGHYSCPGAGSGGGVTSAPASQNGGAAGFGVDSGVARAAGSSSGASPGGSGAAALFPWLPGNAGGGGFGNSAGAATDGGSGTQCAPGGGGGSSLNGSAAGKGGKGGDGYGYIWETHNLRTPANDNDALGERLAA